MESDWLSEVQGALRGRYDVSAIAGVGGMATVFRATRPSDGAGLAVKVLDPRLLEALGPERFLREVSILSGLRHPAIVPLIDSGAVGRVLYYVMPLIEGPNLRTRLKEEPQLPIPEACQAAREVLEALRFAHANNVLHRDIKPENILLDGGQVRVADFGIARAIVRSGGDTLSSTGFVVGTPAYMSPEQAEAAGRLDGRSDLYSVGCVLFEMLVGTPPFAGPTAQAVQARHMHDPPPSLRTVRPSIPPALEDVVHRALAKVPGDRFASAGEFVSALDRAEHAGAGSRLPASRLWGRWAAVAAVVLVAGLGFLKVLRPAHGIDPDRYVVLPFRGGTGLGAEISGSNATRLVWQGLSRWRDLKLVDQAVVEDRVGRTARDLSLADGLAIARGLGAGLAVWGEVEALGDSIRIAAGVFRTGGVVRQAVQRAELVVPGNVGDGSAAGRAFAGTADLVRRLVLPGLTDGEAEGALVATGYVEALRATLAGDSALARWNLPLARDHYRRASEIDPAYAAPWLRAAQSALWSDEAIAAWLPAAEAALTARSQLSPLERLEAEALVALGRGEFPMACDRYRSILASDSLRFSGWFGLGECLTSDSLVVPDAGSRSGWRFRGSYPEGVDAYVRALTVVPLAHRAFGGAALSRLSRYLFAEPNVWRIGVAESGERFAASPALRGDSITFTPYPIAAMVAGAHPEPTSQQALRAGRERLLAVTSGWLSNYPDSPLAMRAHAWSLELSGRLMPTGSGGAAIPLVRKLRQASVAAGRPIELAAWEVRLLLKASLFSAAAALADSILADSATEAPDAVLQAGLAALLGRANRAAELAERNPSRSYRLPTGTVVEVDRSVGTAAERLLVFASIGGPDDSIRAAAGRVRKAIDRTVAPSERDQIAEAVGYRARILAFPILGAPLTPAIPIDRIEAAVAAGDLDAARSEFQDLRASRRHQPTGAVVADHLVLEARLLAQLGDTASARDRLGALLGGLEGLGTDLIEDLAQVAALPRGLALNLAMGGAAGSDTALAALWRNADRAIRKGVRLPNR